MLTALRHDLLDGVTVVETGGGSAVRYAGRLLADAGAMVMRIPVGPERLAPSWAIALDFDKSVLAPGSPEAAKWLETARIVLLGDGTEPEASGSGAVRVHVHGGDDLVLQAGSGICAGIGLPGRPPLKLPLDQSAFQAGVCVAIAACAALAAEGGCDIALAARDVWCSFYAGLDVANARFGRSRTRRAGHRARGVPWPRTIMRCHDGYFAIQCATREHWRRFLELVGRPELETAPIFADRIRANDRHGDEAEAIFADWFVARTKDELLRLFLAARLPGAPVYTPAEVAAHPHLAARGAFRRVSTPSGDVLATNPPWRVTDSPAAASSPARGTASRPLAGLRVLDFGWVWAGAVPGHILADLGAEVIKVESGRRLDYMRQGKPLIGTERDPEQNPMFHCVNRGKLSLRVDMTNPKGAALLRDLVAHCDVVIENFAPGVLDRFGLSWETLARLRPGLVMCSMSAAGATGALRDIRTYATMIAGLCGLDSLVAYPGERVLGSQSSYADPNASLHAAFAILAALERRRRTGQGAWLDLSQWEAGVAVMSEMLAALPGTPPAPEIAPHGLYPAAGEDNWIALAVADDTEFAALRRVLDDPPALSNPLFATQSGRLTSRAALDAAVAAATRGMDAAQIERRCVAAGLQAAEVVTPATLAQRPDLAELYEEVAHPVLGAVLVYRLPWRVNGAPIPVAGRAPFLGEHNDAILRGVLHVPEAKLMALKGEDVFL